MSLYNLTNGVNQATFWILPMLGKTTDEYPRFRDCFLSSRQRGTMGGIIPEAEHRPEYDNKIHIYTRVGGGNRDDYQTEIEGLRAMPGYITDFDDDFDSTFATFIFEIPARWCKDFDAILAGTWKDVSDEYISEVGRIWPKIADKIAAQVKVWREKPESPKTENAKEEG